MKELELKVVTATNILKASISSEKNHASRETVEEYL